MKLFLFVLIGVIVAVNANEAWKNFKKTHNKTYNNDDEELVRKHSFIKNAKAIDDHNERFKNGEVSYEKVCSSF